MLSAHARPVRSQIRVALAVMLVSSLAVVVQGTVSSFAATKPPTSQPRPKAAKLVPPPVPSPAQFVRRDGTKLTLKGHNYRFEGINIYMAASGGTPQSCGGELYPDVSVPLANMPHGVVFRFWAFQNFFVSNGKFNWTNFDHVLAIAAANGDKVIPTLANQYDYCDGPAKDLAWYQSGYKQVDPGDKVSYRTYVAAVVQRYANNPTVAMWQLVNEGEAVNADGSCSEPEAFSALSAFATDVGKMVHRFDVHHLVSLGTLAGYSGSGNQWCGAADADYGKLMALKPINVCDFHEYGYPDEPMGNPDTPDLSTALAMCNADHKPLMVGETGILAAGPDQLAQRAAQFRHKFWAQFHAGVVGELMWAWEVKPQYVTPMQDSDYGIFPGDPSLTVLTPL